MNLTELCSEQFFEYNVSFIAYLALPIIENNGSLSYAVTINYIILTVKYN